MRGSFDNSGRLVRFILRRERTMSIIWIVCLVAFSVSLANGMESMFDDAARQALAITLQNPGIIAMMGPVYGADNYTVGAMYSNTMLIWVIIAVAVMNIFLVIRHTRGDEERGRAEMIRSLPTGRLSILNSTLITAFIVNAILALLTGFGIFLLGVESMSFSGSMLYGAALGVSGFLFAAIAALFSQLSASSRGATGYSFFALGVLYMLRATGDIGNEALSLISPLGLAQRSQIYVENYWWPILILLIESIIITIAAYALCGVRDIDQGFIPARPGRKEASPILSSPFGLAFRLLRNSLIIWIVIMFVLGASYGAVLGDIEAFVAESEFYQMILGMNGEYSGSEMFASFVSTIASLLCLIPLLSAALKLRSEEKDGHTEQVLSKPVSRGKYLTGYIVLSFAVSVILQFVSAAGLFISASVVLDEPIAFSFLLRASMVYLPALWVMIGCAVLLIGSLPKATSLMWAYFAFSFFTVFLGRMISLPEWLPKLTPFGHIPQLPVDSVNLVTLAVLTMIAALLTIVGSVFYRRRDVSP